MQKILVNAWLQITSCNLHTDIGHFTLTSHDAEDRLAYTEVAVSCLVTPASPHSHCSFWCTGHLSVQPAVYLASVDVSSVVEYSPSNSWKSACEVHTTYRLTFAVQSW